MATNKIKTEVELNNSVATVLATVTTLGKELHTLLVDMANNFASSQNVTPATRLYVGLVNASKDGKSHSTIRANAVRAWLEEFAFCSWKKDKKTGKNRFVLNSKRLKEETDNGTLSAHFKNAARIRWNEFTEEKPENAFDLSSAINALIKRANDKFETGKTAEGKEHKVPADLLAKLAALKTEKEAKAA